MISFLLVDNYSLSVQKAKNFIFVCSKSVYICILLNSTDFINFVYTLKSLLFFKLIYIFFNNKQVKYYVIKKF